MKSFILLSFWIEYRKLDDDVRQSARKAYRLKFFEWLLLKYGEKFNSDFATM